MTIPAFLLSLIPSLLLSIVVVLVVRWFLTGFGEQFRAFSNHEQKKHMLTLRMQAYERITIFVERISPQSLIVREQQHSMTSQQFHSHLVKVIRSEYEHNLAMQIYLPGDTWTAVVQARDEIVKLVNTCAAQTDPSHPSMALGQTVIEQASQVSVPYKKALAAIKADVARL